MKRSRPPVRVVIADDSATMRKLIAGYLVGGGCEIVGEAEDGMAAVDLAAEIRPDVITMDVAMPRLDGLAATAAIMAQTPTRIVVICDTQRGDQLDLSFRAMSAGALEIIPKRAASGSTDVWGKRVVESVRLMADVPVVRWKGNAVAASWQYRDTAGTVDAIGIAASTGGPPALAQLLAALPETFPIPILVAQHIGPGFARGLVRWLDGTTRLSVVEATDGMRLAPGTVVLAPDGRELEIAERGKVRTPAPARVDSPGAGDRLLGSLAKSYAERAGGIVLTGMGSDGAEGLLAIKRRGGFTMAQDHATSVVWGMPGAAAQNGATDLLLPIQHMAIKLVQLADSRARKPS
jgi:two-component system chemotaxis response regulator CheB